MKIIGVSLGVWKFHRPNLFRVLMREEQKVTTTNECIVIRGCIDAGIGNAPPGSYGRTFEHRRLRVGDRVMLSADESERLATSGAVKVVS